MRRFPIRSINKVRDRHPPCKFLSDFLFEQVYAKQAVPHGCRNCYKVKVIASTLKGLVAVRDI
ncbi:hypothetical protein CCP3SC1_2030003 [Gammaproteobacteria bacterium]